MKLTRTMIIMIIIALILVCILFFALYPSGEVKLEAIAKDRPDIIVTALVIDPETPQTGDIVTFTGEIKNNGEMPAANITIKIDFGNGELDSLTLVEELLPGETYDFIFDQTYLLAGTYTATVNATCDNDADSSNNLRTVSFDVSSPVNQTYDLTVTDISWTPQNPSVGDTVHFTIHIKNIGAAASEEAQAVFDAGIDQYNFAVPELLPGQAGYEEVSFTYSEAGEYSAYSEIFADDENIYNNFRNESFIISSDAYPVVAAEHEPTENITTETVVFITGSAADDYGLVSIQIYVDAVLKKTCAVNGTSASCVHNSTYYNGTHVYYAKATDSAQHTTTSDYRNFTVLGNATDDPPETNVSFSPTYPSQGDTITITASSLDNIGITKIEVYVDDVLIATCRYTSTPKGECIYKAVFAQGIHELYSEATDNFGKVSVSETVQFIVA